MNSTPHPEISKPPIRQYILRDNAERLHRCGQTLAMIASKPYWETVSDGYAGELPDSRVLRAVRFIFTEDGQLAYKKAKNTWQSTEQA